MKYEFYAQFGDVTTTTPWKRPTMMAVSDWWKEFSFEVGTEEFDFWMVGSFAEKTFGVYNGWPNDFDVIITGEIPSTKTLKRVMDRAIEIGFQKQILVDIMWTSHVTNVYLDDFKPYGNIRNTNLFIKSINEEVQQINFTADEVHPLDDGLYHYIWYEPSSAWKKVKQRTDEGHYIGVVYNCREFFE